MKSNGSLEPEAPPFSEDNRYEPNSSYSASKAAPDHLVRSYYHTFGLPAITTHCSNNYGPYQFPEKLIPLTILNAIEGRPLPIYGDGLNVGDWLYVTDHCSAIRAVLKSGRPGETYNVGGSTEHTNIQVVRTICALLGDLRPTRIPHESLITYVEDRAGHDRRYGVNSAKLQTQLGWAPVETFESGLAKTVRWYLANPEWITKATSSEYRKWVTQQYGDRGRTPKEDHASI